ncbi:myosin light chain alkali-like [Sitophilus oryzae]|uniref:Myosin light chain alkali-like n=1 Tax=Sitophilus oryzae TaxID=7048 RepID=A0A6J2XZW7_SITOR|nr:myosin light chain alkali-like [Sitophilus oryzae]
MGDKLKPSEMESLDFAMEVYGGKEKIIDAKDLGMVARAMNCNPSLETLEKLGATKKAGEKKMKIEDVVPVIIELKKNKKDEGCYEDFVECLKLYDKADDGHMGAGDLPHMLLSLAEKLTDAEVDELFEDCLDEEDDEGMILYDPFLRRMCELDPPLKKKK